MKKLIMIVNPNAGKRRLLRYIPQIVSYFSENGCSVTTYYTKKKGDAAEICAKTAKNYDLVVCCGGDGTLNEVVSGLMLLPSCPLDQVVRNTIKSLAPLFITQNLSLEIENISVSVLTDEKWLQFALEQILSNAAKYTRLGGVTIRLSDPSRPELVIQDSGIGIQPEDLPRVTDWGYTGQNGHSGTRSTGIGLALCREILEMLGHRMCIESTPGVGTSVYLDFSRNELEIF